MPDTLLAWRKFYAELGLSQFPQLAKTKVPPAGFDQKSYFDGSKRATEQDLEEWSNAGYNIAIALGPPSKDLVVADFDSEELWNLFWSQQPDRTIDKYFVVKSSRGYQVWAFDPEAKNLKEYSRNAINFRNSADKQLDMELLLHSHPITAPPSVHASGHVYALIGQNVISTKPGFAKAILERAESLHWKPISNFKDFVSDAAKGGSIGNRNSKGFVRARTLLFYSNLDENGAWEEFQHWNKLNIPPLPNSELKTIFTSAKHYGKDPEAIDKYNSEIRNAIVKKTDLEDHAIIARQILDSEEFKTKIATVAESEDIYLYNSGIFVRNAVHRIKQMIQELYPNSNESFVGNVLGQIRRLTFHEISEFDKDLYLLNLKNGMLNIKTNEFSPHSPSYLSLVQFPFDYNPECLDTTAIDTMNAIIPDPLDREVFLYYVALCFWRHFYKKALMMLGPTDSGKTTLMSLIKALVGPENISNSALQELEEDKYAVADIFGKLVNIRDDIRATAMKSVSNFKQLTGGSTLRAQRKYGQPFSFLSNAKQIYSANELPDTVETTDAVFNRWILITFSEHFVRSEFYETHKDDPHYHLQDKSMVDRIQSPEALSGFFNAILPKIQEIISTGGLPNYLEPSPEDIKAVWLLKAKSTVAFVEEMISKGEVDSVVPSSLIIAAYELWCARNQRKVESSKALGQAISVRYGQAEPTRIDSKATKAYRGIQLKSYRSTDSPTVIYPEENEHKMGGKGVAESVTSVTSVASTVPDDLAITMTMNDKIAMQADKTTVDCRVCGLSLDSDLALAAHLKETHPNGPT